MAKKDSIKNSDFERSLLALESYIKEHGAANMPACCVTADGLDLGALCSSWRSMKAKDRLSQDQVARLEAIPGWSWNLYDQRWMERLACLQGKQSRMIADPPADSRALSPQSFLCLIVVRV